MAKMQKGWVMRSGGVAGWPIRRLSVDDAREIIAQGGKRFGTEVVDKDGYAVGFLTRAQWAKIDTAVPQSA